MVKLFDDDRTPDQDPDQLLNEAIQDLDQDQLLNEQTPDVDQLDRLTTPPVLTNGPRDLIVDDLMLDQDPKLPSDQQLDLRLQDEDLDLRLPKKQLLLDQKQQSEDPRPRDLVDQKPQKREEPLDPSLHDETLADKSIK